jgi:hypothetical protein
MNPLFGADRISVQGIDNRIPTSSVMLVARRQDDNNFSVGIVALQIALNASNMHQSVLNQRWLCSDHFVGHVGQDLRPGGCESAAANESGGNRPFHIGSLLPEVTYLIWDPSP